MIKGMDKLELEGIIRKLPKIKYFSLTGKVIAMIMNWMNKSSAHTDDMIRALVEIKKDKLISHRELLGALIFNGIDKLGAKMIKNFSESDLRTQVYKINNDDKDKQHKAIAKMLVDGELDIDDIYKATDELDLDRNAFFKLGIDIDAIKKWDKENNHK